MTVFKTRVTKYLAFSCKDYLKFKKRSIDSLFKDTLVNYAIGHEKSISKKLLERNVELYPESSVSHCLLGELNLKLGKFDLVYLNFIKAKELNFDMWKINHKIAQCKNELNK